MKLLFFIYLISLLQASCGSESKKATQKTNEIKCTENGCSGVYTGPEFVNGEDIAHQFSNKISSSLGDKLKQLYLEKNYKKVNLYEIEMSTQGMGSGVVVYTIYIPFISVTSKCEAYTSFDHVGGWNHTPALEKRKNELRDVTLPGNQLDISELKVTPEGLQEYWIQWKNRKIQIDCAK